ncbi:MAG TPA: mechanosensitive ion channel domain-containing protein [Gaiellaceae bacterium]|nr:mechanosensitive ion channel domain-containing protein [Gaiellaceae bacterium]
MPVFWQHVLIAALVIAATWIVAKLVDWRLAHKELSPDVATRYRVLRQVVFVTIVCVGVFSALLVIPQVRAVAGAILASSAVIGLVIGLAAQRTIGNVVAGILIALAQPLRLGDLVEVEGTSGTVEQIGLTYTWLRTADDDRLVVPNERLAAAPILNETIRNPGTIVEATVKVPMARLDELLPALHADGEDAYVTDLDGDTATIAVKKAVSGAADTEREASNLRIELARRLARSGR